MRLKTRIDNLCNIRMLLQPFSQNVSIFTMDLHSSFKGLHSSKNKVRIEGRRIGSNTLGGKEELVKETLVTNNESSSDNIGMSSNILRKGMENDIDTELNGTLEIW